MARLSDNRAVSLDERGVVYVEFIIAFMPLFLLFLAVCQLALLAAARLVVQHAALSGVRSAIVILDDDPKNELKLYGGAPRGSLSMGSPSASLGIETALAKLGLVPGAGHPPPGAWAGASAALVEQATTHQQGARMIPIREAAEFPLLSLAPNEASVVRPQEGSVAASLGSSVAGQLVFALGYSRAATVISVHVGDSEQLAPEPIARDAAVRVRVTYLYSCGVPLVRALMCSSLASLFGSESEGNVTPLGKRFDLAEDQGGLQRLAGPGAFFMPLNAEATLPNQGAAY